MTAWRPDLEPLNEYDQILVPTADGYQAFTLMQIANTLWRASAGFGMAPLHFITQRGPAQDGSTPLDMRYDERIVQLVVGGQQGCRSTYWDRRWDILDFLRPNRAFGTDGIVSPLVYRKWLPAGADERGCDLETTAGSNEVVSRSGRFVGRGLEPGHGFTILTGADAGAHVITEVPNDYTLVLSAALGATATGICWQFMRGWGKFDLYCLVEVGPSFDEGPGPLPFAPAGFDEVLRLVAHDPFWYGREQTETWALPADFGDLVFDGAGAWLGTAHGVGRWLFAPTAVGETVNIVYWGTRFAKPAVVVDGPAENVNAINTTISAALSLGSYAIAAGETVIIDTLEQTVTNNAGNNLMHYLEGDLAKFGLFPEPQAPGRRNEVFVSFSGATPASAARLLWRNRYVGI